MAATQPVAAAAVATPQPLSPVGGAEVRTNTPTLSWTRVDGAAKYDVWIDDNSDFTSPTKVSTTNSRYVLSAPLTNGSQFWEVRAYSGSTAGEWATGDFFIEQLDGPALSTPANGATLAQPADPPVLTWSPVAGATSYSIQVAGNDTFTASLKSYTTKTTSYVVPDQVPNGTYYWRVTANFATNISSKASEVRSYTIGPLPQVTGATATPADPSDTASASNNLVFDWDPVKGAKYYNIWVSSDPSFNDTTRTAVDPATKVYGTRFSPRDNIPQASYFWKVRAVNADGKFIEWPNVTRQGPFTHSWLDKPEIVYPQNGATVGDPFFFQWTPVAHATSYQLMISPDPTFTDAKPDLCPVAGTTYTPGSITPDDNCMPSEGGVYYWQVRAVDDPEGLNGQYNDLVDGQPYSFTYEPRESNPVRQTSPASGETVDVPILEWDAVPNTETYDVIVKSSTGDVTKGAGLHTNRWVVPDLDPADGPFTWTVQAVDAYGTRSTIPVQGPSFTLSGNLPPTSGLPPLTPLKGSSTHGTYAENHTTRFPLLTWEPMAGVDHYGLCIGTHRTDGGNPTCDIGKDTSVNRTNFHFPAAVGTGDGYFAEGAYDWAVLAYDKYGAILASGPFTTFYITPLDPVSDTRLALSGTAVLQDIDDPSSGTVCRTRIDYATNTGTCTDVPETPVFAWDAVDGASYYKIYVATSPNLTQMVYDDGHDERNQDRTVSTMWTPFGKHAPMAMPDATADTPYYWYVLPCKSRSQCNLDPHGRTNIATNGFTKISPAPALLSPADGTGISANDPTFSWSDYLTTNQGTTWRGQHPHQTARQYRIQIGPDPSFPSTGTVTEEVDQTTFTPFAQLLPEGDLYWRVQAIDAAGNGLQWSETRRFRKTTPSVTVLNSPAADVRTMGTIAFAWAPTEFAVNYRITVFLNDTGTRVWQATTAQTAYADDVPLATSDKPYRWQVERQDASGHWNQASPLQTFYVSGDAPTQVGPAAGQSVAANDAYFRWNDVIGASKYKLEYQRSGTSSPTTVTVNAREYAPTSTLAAGSYQWRVTALDAGGKPMTAAPSWTPLTVTGITTTTTTTPGKPGQGTPGVDASPRITSFSPRSGAKVSRTTTFKVVFSEAVKGVTASTVKLLQKGKSKGVKLRIKLSSDKRTLTFKPTKKLSRKKTYTAKLTNGIKDLTGHSIPAKRWSVKVK